VGVGDGAGFDVARDGQRDEREPSFEVPHEAWLWGPLRSCRNAARGAAGDGSEREGA
jgi:hypothetical protein